MEKLIYKTPALVIKEWNKNPEVNKNAIRSTNFAAIDTNLTGLRPKQFTIIAGRPGTGKTTFILNIINNVIDSYNQSEDTKNIILFISLEQTAEEITQKFISINGLVELGFFNNVSNIKTEIIDVIPETIKKVSSMRVIVFDNPSTTVEEIPDIITHFLNSGWNVKAVFIDHIQILNSRELVRSPLYEKVSHVSRKIKEIALNFDLPVIALAQLSREAVKTNKTNDNKPNSDLSFLKNSGNLEQDADIVLFLKENKFLQEENEQTLWIEILKNRNGAKGGHVLKFLPSFGIIEDFDNSPKSDIISRRYKGV